MSISGEKESDETELWAEAFQRCLAPLPAAGSEIVEKSRKTLDFNTNWIFVRGDDMEGKDIIYEESGAEEVSLPHARREYDLYRPYIKDIQSMDWYRRHFTLPLED